MTSNNHKNVSTLGFRFSLCPRTFDVYDHVTKTVYTATSLPFSDSYDTRVQIYISLAAHVPILCAFLQRLTEDTFVRFFTKLNTKLKDPNSTFSLLELQLFNIHGFVLLLEHRTDLDIAYACSKLCQVIPYLDGFCDAMGPIKLLDCRLRKLVKKYSFKDLTLHTAECIEVTDYDEALVEFETPEFSFANCITVVSELMDIQLTSATCHTDAKVVCPDVGYAEPVEPDDNRGTPGFYVQQDISHLDVQCAVLTDYSHIASIHRRTNTITSFVIGTWRSRFPSWRILGQVYGFIAFGVQRLYNLYELGLLGWKRRWRSSNTIDGID